jgi:hypothetical protein
MAGGGGSAPLQIFSKLASIKRYSGNHFAGAYNTDPRVFLPPESPRHWSSFVGGRSWPIEWGRIQSEDRPRQRVIRRFIYRRCTMRVLRRPLFWRCH